MAIGENYSNNGSNQNNNKQNDTTYYSRFKIRSKDSKRSLGISFWAGLLIIDINDVDTANGFKVTALETIRLSPTKAKILLHEIDAFKAYLDAGVIDPNKAFGVSSGLGNEVPYIGFSATPDKVVVITIGKINNSGNILNSQSFTLDNNEYQYGLEWKNINTMDVESVPCSNIDLDMIVDVLKDFSAHMNGALAYSIADFTRYDNIRMNRRFDAIYDKLGIEKYNGNGGNRGNYQSNNFLSNLSSSNRSTSTTIDNLEGLLDD